MTLKAFYAAVADNAITDEVIEFAKAKVAKTAAEDADKAAEKETIIAAVTADPKTAQEIAAEVGFSWQKVSTILSQAVKNGAPITKGKNDEGKVTYTVA